jgi:rod shape-determining protein MreD
MAAADARPKGAIWETGLLRVAAITAIVLVALTLQSTLLAQLTILGVIPQLVLVVVVTVAYLDGDRIGAATGFASGLLVDLLIPQSIVGLTALVYTLVGYGVGVFREYTSSDSVWAPMLAVAVSSVVAEAGYALLAIILGQTWVGVIFTIKVIGLVALYNCLLTPFTFPLVRKVDDRFRPDRVYRW